MNTIDIAGSEEFYDDVQRRFPHTCAGRHLHGWFPYACSICRWVIDHWNTGSDQ